MQQRYTMRNSTSSVVWQVRKHTPLMRYVFSTLKPGLGRDRGALSEGSITQLGCGGVGFGFLEV